MITSRTWLMASSTLLGLPGALLALPGAAMAQTTAPAASPAPAPEEPMQTIIVTGTTSKARTLITSSADVTLINAQDIARKAPRAVADILEVVPGIFVEGTAGNVSNNYSVRGLQGGSTSFITFQEDGLPVLYRGTAADEYFSPDVNVDHIEAVKGGSSGILTPNGAGATINFITRKPNHDHAEGIVRIGGSSYGEKRADAYYSAPLGHGLAFNVGGYFSSSPGVRKSAFNYNTYHVKAELEKKFDNGGSILLSGKIGDQHDAYYADQPYQFGANGKVSSVPGLSGQYGNIGGSSFANIQIPASCATGTCLRSFNMSTGIRALTKQLRLDVDMPVSETISVFAKSRYMRYTWDFNGIFPGSGVGNAGLTSAANYLTPGSASPINSLLQAGLAAYPTTTQFGIKDLTTGQIIAASNTSALNALNGNGLLQQTWLNRDYETGYDWGNNAGVRIENKGDSWANSLTLGVMYFQTDRNVNQSAVAHVINGVTTNSHLYDIVALNSAGAVVGTLTDNGLVSYGDWGQGMSRTHEDSWSFYANDEFRIGEKLRIDLGFRDQDYTQRNYTGNTAAVNQSVPAGTAGLAQDVGPTFDGTYSVARTHYNKAAFTVGANYMFTPHVSAYARYAQGFQDNVNSGGGSATPTTLQLYEAGLRYGGHGLTAQATVFQTRFKNQFYNFIDPTNPTVQGSFQGNLNTTGVELDLNYRHKWFMIDASGVFQNPRLHDIRINGVTSPAYDNHRPERTPSTLWQITPSVFLPHHLGEVYARYKYIGKIYADAGNGLALPSYGVTSIGFHLNISERLGLDASVDNLFNVSGITEGNPRQGQTQTVSTGGYFYGRGIVGTNGNIYATLKF